MTLQAPFTRTTPDRSSARTGERGVELTAPHEALVAAARDPRAPLLRRLRLIGAVGRRVDALFQLRSAELRARETGERGAAARARVRALLAETHAIFAGDVLPALRARGIALRAWAELPDTERRTLARIFVEEVSPLLTPLTADAAHPFPCVASLALSVAVLVRAPRGAGERYVGIEVPPAVPPFLSATPGGPLVAIEEVIGANLGSLLPGLEVNERAVVVEDGAQLGVAGLCQIPLGLEDEVAGGHPGRELLLLGFKAPLRELS